jgi:hypothetical protein
MQQVIDLYNSLKNSGVISEDLEVKMSLDGDTYLFRGTTSDKWWYRFPLYNQDGSLYLNARCEALYVPEKYVNNIEMTSTPPHLPLQPFFLHGYAG